MITFAEIFKMNSNHKSSGGRQARKGNSPQRKNSFRKDFKKPLTTPKKVDVGGIRLNKFISNSSFRILSILKYTNIKLFSLVAQLEMAPRCSSRPI